jgi:hypothetical protein
LAEAQSLGDEGLRLALDVEARECIFQGRILLARLALARGEGVATQERLRAMLAATKDEVERAALHYELWEVSQDASHAQQADQLYDALYARTPNIQYRNRLDALRGAGVAG